MRKLLLTTLLIGSILSAYAEPNVVEVFFAKVISGTEQTTDDHGAIISTFECKDNTNNTHKVLYYFKWGEQDNNPYYFNQDIVLLHYQGTEEGGEVYDYWYCHDLNVFDNATHPLDKKSISLTPEEFETNFKPNIEKI